MPSHARDDVDLAARLAPNRAAIFVGIDVGLFRNGRTNDGFTSISALIGGRYVRIRRCDKAAANSSDREPKASMMKHSVIDLVAAADALPDEHKTLAHLIYQLRDSHSIRTDLALANDFVSTMKEIGGEAAAAGAGGHAENAFLALFYSTLVLYVRATKTQHDNRRSFDFNKEFDADQKVKHKALCDLRDEALSHYGTGGTYNGPSFQKDGVFIPYGPDSNGAVMTASHRLVVSPQLIADLGQMVHRALMLADKRTQLLNQKVVETINTSSQTSPDLFPILRQHLTDLADFLGSDEAAEVVMSGSRVGYRRGTARH